MADKKKNKKVPVDLVDRGVKGPSPAGTLSFVGLRAADPFLQYKILAGGWGTALLAHAGVSTISPLHAIHTGVGLVDNLHIPLPHLLVLGMSVGAAAKQTYWLTAVSQEVFPLSAAVTVSGLNTVVNAVNSLLLLATPTSTVLSTPFPGTDIPYPYVVGPAIYAVGIILETVSEVQRRNFKEGPNGRGKVMREGLWSYARHINYGGNALWRGAYALTAGGAVAGLTMGLWQAWDFATRAVPALDSYCGERYGEQWANFKREVKWVLLPGIY